MRDCVLNSVNLDRYKDGTETYYIYIEVSEQGDGRFLINVRAQSISKRYEDESYFKKSVSLDE